MVMVMVIKMVIDLKGRVMEPAKPVVGQGKLVTANLWLQLDILAKFNFAAHLFHCHTLIACAARLPKWVIPSTLNSRHLKIE